MLVFKEHFVDNGKYYNVLEFKPGMKYKFSPGTINGHVRIECISEKYLSLCNSSSTFSFEIDEHYNIENLMINDVSQSNTKQEFSFNGVYKIEFDITGSSTQ